MKTKPRQVADGPPGVAPSGALDTLSWNHEAGAGEPTSLLAVVAHRLSQPLTALRGTLELARLKARSAAEYRTAVEKALESAERLAWLVQAMRELAEADAPAGEPVPVMLDQVTGSVLENLRPIAEARAISLESRIETGVLARTYPERLYEVLLKVVHYSIFHSPEGKTVRLELRAVQEGAEWSVTGEGAPFSLPDAEHFIETFFAEHAVPGGFGETALGVVTARRVVAALGGSLAVESAARGGNRIVIRLPASSSATP